MKVLMLGWEFPPHISGGLGTACYGLTRGLAAKGVDVVFVVPRAFGDEDTHHLDLIGLTAPDRVDDEPSPTVSDPRPAGNGAPVPPTPAGPEGPATAAARPQDAPALPVVPAVPVVPVAPEAPAGEPAPPMRVVEVDSMLRPYLDESSYRALLAAREAPAPAAAGTRPPGRDLASWGAFVEHVARPPIAQEHANANATPETEAPARPDAAGAAEAEAFAEVERAGEDEAPPPFEGGYGASLMDEVGRYAEAVAQIARETSFDLIHAHDWMTFPAAVAASRISGKPLVVHVHASEYDRSGEHPNPEVLELERLGLIAAQRIVAVSHLTARVLRERYGADGDRIRVVHNAVVQNGHADRPAETKAITDPLVLFLGRVTLQKGPEYFLEAAKRVLEVRPDVRFVMSGSGDMLPGMIEHAARIGIGRNVHFTGFLQGEDVERMYEMADLYVMPSVSEPFGITPLEAMRLDTPVIVSRQSGVSEVLQNVLKVDFWDIEDLANKILAVLVRPALRQELRREGLDEVRGLRWEHSAARLRQVYEEVLA